MAKKIEAGAPFAEVLAAVQDAAVAVQRAADAEKRGNSDLANLELMQVEDALDRAALALHVARRMGLRALMLVADAVQLPNVKRIEADGGLVKVIEFHPPAPQPYFPFSKPASWPPTAIGGGYVGPTINKTAVDL